MTSQAFGALVGAIVASRVGPNVFVFGICVLLLGPLCALLRSDRSAYRFGGVTLAIVMLLPRSNPAWQIAFHRFAEVSIGIGVALGLIVLWPETEEPRPENELLTSRGSKSSVLPTEC